MDACPRDPRPELLAYLIREAVSFFKPPESADPGVTVAEADEIERVPVSERLPGIDVSNHQGAVAWRRVVEAGHRFAFIKATEGGANAHGEGFVDPRFLENVRGARAAGIDALGAYHFATWYNADRKRPERDAKNEAEHFARNLERADLIVSSLRPVLDLEHDRREPKDNRLGDATIVAWAVEFLERLEELTGRRPMIYTGFWFDFRLGQPAELRRWNKWLACYSRRRGEPKRPRQVPDPRWPWTFWQTTGSGSVAGIEGRVDLNVFAGTAEDLAELCQA